MILLPAKRHIHIFNMLITSVQSFKLIAWKLWEELITQTCHPILKPNLKIFQVQNAVHLSKMMFLLAKSHMHIFNMLITSVKVSNWLLENSGRSWLHKLATPYWSLTWKFSKYKLKPNLKIVQVQNAVILSKNIFSPEKNSHAHLQYIHNMCAWFRNRKRSWLHKFHTLQCKKLPKMTKFERL